MAKRSRKITHEQAILAYCLLGGLPAVAFAFVWMFGADRAPEVRATVGTPGPELLARVRVRAPAARRPPAADDVQPPHGASRGGLLLPRARRRAARPARRRAGRDQRPGRDPADAEARGAARPRRSSTAVMKEIDVAIFAFDAEGILRLVNPAGQVLLGQPAERLLGRDARAIGLADCLEGEPNRILSPAALPRVLGRWNMRRTTFREDGRPHQLVVFGDLSPAAARGAAQVLAAARAGPGPRAQQLPGPDQVDRRHAGNRHGPQAAPARLGGGHAVGARHHLGEGGEPRAVPRGLLAPRQAAASAGCPVRPAGHR
jgi:two-component system nitrogen regulation sensor histidine kinase NtrY